MMSIQVSHCHSNRSFLLAHGHAYCHVTQSVDVCKNTSDFVITLNADETSCRPRQQSFALHPHMTWILIPKHSSNSVSMFFEHYIMTTYLYWLACVYHINWYTCHYQQTECLAVLIQFCACTAVLPLFLF
jgi:hypothetical protein